MIPENRLKSDFLNSFVFCCVCTVLYLIFSAMSNPVYDCAHYVKDALSPSEHNYLIGQAGVTRPNYKTTEKWCEVNISDWYELAQIARKTGL